MSKTVSRADWDRLVDKAIVFPVENNLKKANLPYGSLVILKGKDLVNDGGGDIYIIRSRRSSDVFPSSKDILLDNGDVAEKLELALAGEISLYNAVLTGTPTAPTPTHGDDSTTVATTAFVQDAKSGAVTMANSYTDEQIRQHGNLPVGYEYFTFNPSIPQGSLPLFGGEYDRATYSDLWAWVQTQSGYLKTEAEWQTLSTANNGNVPYYSSGDGSTTFRVPSLHCWIKGSDGSAQLVGSYLAAGLPNITGSVNKALNTYQLMFAQLGEISVSGALDIIHSNQTLNQGSASGVYDLVTGFSYDASRSSAIYGNANTVQPESIVGMWLVKAYGTIVDTGQIDEQAYIDDRYNAMKTYVDGKFLPAVGNAVVGDLSAVQYWSVLTSFGPTIYMHKIGRLVTMFWNGTGTLPATQTKYDVATITQAYLPVIDCAFDIVLTASNAVLGHARVSINSQNGTVSVESNRADLSEWIGVCSYISAS